MKSSLVIVFGPVIVLFAGIGLCAAGIESSNTVVSTPAVYVPDMTHSSGPLGDDVLAWDKPSQETNVSADVENAHFVFNFTNVSSGNVAIMDAHPSCGCTTAQLPQRPWIITPGANNQIGVTVNLAGKSGTIFKTVKISTDKGSRDLLVRITILPVVIPPMSDADRARGVARAKIDRQAVFKNDCAACHAKPGEGKYGKELYDAVCAVCHEAEHRATMVPDLHEIKTATNDDFWRTWIANGKAGSLMPAFSTAEGGPLSDMQIASLAAYLNQAMPSHVAPSAQ
jgi:mono/diheme cytochrome c family protein